MWKNLASDCGAPYTPVLWRKMQWFWEAGVGPRWGLPRVHRPWGLGHLEEEEGLAGVGLPEFGDHVAIHC